MSSFILCEHLQKYRKYNCSCIHFWNSIATSIVWVVTSSVNPLQQGRGGEELSTELSSALQKCLLGGKSGAGATPKYILTSFSYPQLLRVSVLMDLLQVLGSISHLCALSRGRSVGICTSMVS